MRRTWLLVLFLASAASSAPAAHLVSEDETSRVLLLSNGLVQLAFSDANSGFALSGVRGSGSDQVSIQWFNALVCVM